MRILDRYILSRFLYNFLSSFVILMFIFIFQTIWLFIDDFAGKGLDIGIIGKFFFYMMPSLTEKVLPLTVILASILTFGTLAENYEFAAMKASGISLQRSMLSLIIFMVVLGGVTFYFANSVIPASEQKIYNMRRNIAKVKPAAAIEKGVFSDFEGMSIKVDEKYGEKDRFLKNVIIHQKTPANVNSTVIKAKTGELISSEDSELIQLVLRDGHDYRDMDKKKSTEKRKYPFTNSYFEIYRMNIEIPEMEQDLEEENVSNREKMKNVSRLIKDMDSIETDNRRIVQAFSKNIVYRMGAFIPLTPKDTAATEKMNLLREKEASSNTVSKNAVDTVETKEGVKIDSLSIADTPINSEEKTPPKEIISLFKDWQKVQVMNAAKNSVSNIMTSIEGKKQELDKRYEIHRRHIFSLHEKYALALSCIILFFVGAPLGAIIRKGGIGLPMVVAILLFLVYYFLGVFAENYSYKGNIHPIIGAWLSSMVMLPLGIYLTRQATADQGMMNFGNVIDLVKRLFSKKDKTEEE
ncbi:YjgP/YjgQ family permease [Zobellia amurskyensis]|uniref:YjgP/YjgQ family permease n=1 Tax=Zobellia amurskyensis TaxID=248905 RepID=A0A7X3D3Z7_9FLAO|nr:LptF/LptG family permease [Zobellia amurskyensis]MUH38028.1 YjgP/YjgQ family permease [Zobellia amurskyensis]